MKANKLLIVLSFLIALVACGTKHSEDHHEQEGQAEEVLNWDAMDKFHLIMAECYHPFKDSSNLEPAKKYAQELADHAVSWVDQPLPSVVDNEEVKAMLVVLKEGAQHFATTVAGGNDEEIASELEKIHDDFHKIQEAWYSSKGQGASEDHDH